MLPRWLVQTEERNMRKERRRRRKKGRQGGPYKGAEGASGCPSAREKTTKQPNRPRPSHKDLSDFSEKFICILKTFATIHDIVKEVVVNCRDKPRSDDF
jgi:hypothetical protein